MLWFIEGTDPKRKVGSTVFAPVIYARGGRLPSQKDHAEQHGQDQPTRTRLSSWSLPRFRHFGGFSIETRATRSCARPLGSSLQPVTCGLFLQRQGLKQGRWLHVAILACLSGFGIAGSQKLKALATAQLAHFLRRSLVWGEAAPDLELELAWGGITIQTFPKLDVAPRTGS